MAFKALAERYYPRVYRMLLALTRSEDAAMDLTQETFVKALQALPNFSMASSFYTWLYRIARNAAYDRFRRGRTQAETEYDDGFEARTMPGASGSTPMDPPRAVAARERLVAVREALDELRPEHREILVLREMEDLSYEEIAASLDLKMGTVMSRLFAARMRLREALEARLGR
jgi:RNA polymerase sigma-70 factor (ECF subfamily)